MTAFLIKNSVCCKLGKKKAVILLQRFPHPDYMVRERVKHKMLEAGQCLSGIWRALCFWISFICCWALSFVGQLLNLGLL